MDQYLKQQTLENLAKAQSIIVAVSSTAGFDGLAAGLALNLSLAKLGKNSSIFVSQLPTVNDARMLYGVDQITQKNGKQNLVFVIDDAVKNVDKVTYFLEGDKLKIIVHSLPGSIGVSQEQISFEQTSSKSDLIFAVGIKSSEELKREITHEQYIDSNTWILAIHKEGLQHKFAQVNFVDTGAVSFSEIVSQVFRDLALPVDEDIAYNLYAGIGHATQNFSPSIVRPTTFQVAEWLIKFGAGKANLAGNSGRMDLSQEVIPTVQTQYSTRSFNGQRQPSPKKVEVEKRPQDWLNPPKIYKGSSSFDRE